MNQSEHLLTVLAEECGEVAHEVHKALRFGLDDHNPHDPFHTKNRDRITHEIGDLLAVVAMAEDAGLIGPVKRNKDKPEKVQKYMGYARNTGALS